MDKVLDLARELGKAIGETDRFKKLRAAEGAMQKDEKARGLLDQFESAQADIAAKETDGRPIEPEEKRRLEDLRAAVHQDPSLQNIARAQADYMELMNSVNRVIRAQLGVDEGA